MNQELVDKGNDDISNLIKRAITTKQGLLIGRHGTIEFQAMMSEITSEVAATLEKNAGIFPQFTASMWATFYKNASLAADGIATGWYEPMAKKEIEFVTKQNPKAIQYPLRSLEPYYTKSMPWTTNLEQRRVTVVSSFTETMKKQLTKKSFIWDDPYILPSNAQWSFVRTFYPPNITNRLGWKFSNWKEAINDTVEKVIETRAEIVLIGCGGLAMPIGHELKRRGVIVIVMGGAIQVLFGIKGERWATHPVISKFWNSAWVYPSKDETPDHANLVEDTCYWKK
jgi:hypothetical protein